MYRIRGNMVYTTIQGITEVGEEFDLPSSDFYPHSVARVTRIMAQGGGGQTDIELQIIQGGALPLQSRESYLIAQGIISENDHGFDPYEDPYADENADPYAHMYNSNLQNQPIIYGADGLQHNLHNVDFIDYELPRDRFEEGREVLNQGGTDKVTFFRDSEVRRGANSNPVRNSPVDQLVGGKMSNPLMQQQPSPAPHPTVQEYGRGAQQSIDGSEGGARASEIFAREEGNFNNEVGQRGGYRRSQAVMYGKRDLPEGYQPRSMIIKP